MRIHNQEEFVRTIQSIGIDTERILIKPNWVDNQPGNFTEPIILDWLLSAFPKQEKIIIESYTPWRGEKLKNDLPSADLEESKKYWETYKQIDKDFLDQNGTQKILEKHNARYINVTDLFWKNETADPQEIRLLTEQKYGPIFYQEFYSYIPKTILEHRKETTLISCAKIKLETENPHITVSLSVKNLFGLIPNPSRRNYHLENHRRIPQAITNIYKIYDAIFESSLWLNEGIFSMVEHYCEPNQGYRKNLGLLFAGRDGIETDRDTCESLDIDPNSVPYLKKT